LEKTATDEPLSELQLAKEVSDEMRAPAGKVKKERPELEENGEGVIFELIK
jgi:hypothetical protein